MVMLVPNTATSQSMASSGQTVCHRHQLLRQQGEWCCVFLRESVTPSIDLADGVQRISHSSLPLKGG